MKRFTAILLVFFMLTAIFSSCKTADKKDDGKIKIVCTVFPQYDWVRQILGEKTDDFNITLLLKNNADLHSYQPSFDDIDNISMCDLFIYIGGESDKWVKDALKEATNKNMVVINLLETLGDAAKEEEVVEGMEADKDDDGGGEEVAYDEHVWLSLKNACVLCPVIADALKKLDSDNAEKYQNNLNAYIEKLLLLNSEYQKAVDDAPVKTLLFCDRFPFRYLADDYGLDYKAAFLGCSAETEASFDTIIYLSDKIDELKLKNIIVIESSNQSIAKTVRDNTKEKNQNILVMDSMQSVTLNDIKNGTTYFSIMENNLNVLKEALK